MRQLILGFAFSLVIATAGSVGAQGFMDQETGALHEMPGGQVMGNGLVPGPWDNVPRPDYAKRLWIWYQRQRRRQAISVATGRNAADRPRSYAESNPECLWNGGSCRSIRTNRSACVSIWAIGLLTPKGR
jgi:hypothetical protein